MPETTLTPSILKHLFKNNGVGPELNSEIIDGGHASTADKLTSSVTITLTGDASGSISFDGSEDATINVAINGAPPIGTVIMWSGSFGGTNNRFPIDAASKAVNTNWCLCDGTSTNGLTVPDLRDKFVVGSGSTYSVGNTGGSASQTASVSVTVSQSGTTGSTTISESTMPSHRHQIYRSAGGSGNANIGNGPDPCTSSSYSEYTGGSGSGHTHSFSVSASGTGSTTITTLPPYYALAYVMRCA